MKNESNTTSFFKELNNSHFTSVCWMASIYGPHDTVKDIDTITWSALEKLVMFSKINEFEITALIFY